jgi:hypothetical protein
MNIDLTNRPLARLNRPAGRRQRFGYRITIVLVNIILVLLRPTSPVLAQPQASGLRVVIVEGQGAINNVRTKSARDPVVRVEDEAGRPVAGATVTFIAPTIGPGATFFGGSPELSVQTDEAGRAVGRSLRPNSQVGQFQIRVTATYRGGSARATIIQTNAAPAGGTSRKRTYVILGIAAGAVAGGLVAALGGGNGGVGPQADPPGANPVDVTPGTPGFGPPR